MTSRCHFDLHPSLYFLHFGGWCISFRINFGHFWDVCRKFIQVWIHSSFVLYVTFFSKISFKYFLYGGVMWEVHNAFMLDPSSAPSSGQCLTNIYKLNCRRSHAYGLCWPSYLHSTSCSKHNSKQNKSYLQLIFIKCECLTTQYQYDCPIYFIVSFDGVWISVTFMKWWHILKVSPWNKSLVFS